MTDSSDYRLYLESKFDGLASHLHAQFEIVHEKLDNLEKKTDRIEVQTTRTNGRVTKLESEVHEELPHTKDGCPQKKTIDEIHDYVLEEKVLKVKAKEDNEVNHTDKVRWIMVVGILVSVALSILNNFRTHKNNTDITGLKTEVDMINTPVRTRGGVIQWYPSGVVIDSLNKK